MKNPARASYYWYDRLYNLRVFLPAAMQSDYPALQEAVESRIGKRPSDDHLLLVYVVGKEIDFDRVRWVTLEDLDREGIKRTGRNTKLIRVHETAPSHTQPAPEELPQTTPDEPEPEPVTLQSPSPQPEVFDPETPELTFESYPLDALIEKVLPKVSSELQRVVELRSTFQALAEQVDPLLAEMEAIERDCAVDLAEQRTLLGWETTESPEPSKQHKAARQAARAALRALLAPLWFACDLGPDKAPQSPLEAPGRPPEAPTGPVSELVRPSPGLAPASTPDEPENDTPDEPDEPASTTWLRPSTSRVEVSTPATTNASVSAFPLVTAELRSGRSILVAGGEEVPSLRDRIRKMAKELMVDESRFVHHATDRSRLPTVDFTRYSAVFMLDRWVAHRVADGVRRLAKRAKTPIFYAGDGARFRQACASLEQSLQHSNPV